MHPPQHSWVPPQPPSARPMWPWVLAGVPSCWLLAVVGLVATAGGNGAGVLAGLAPVLLGLVLLGPAATRQAGKGLLVGGVIGVAMIALLAGSCVVLVRGLFGY